MMDINMQGPKRSVLCSPKAKKVQSRYLFSSVLRRKIILRQHF